MSWPENLLDKMVSKWVFGQTGRSDCRSSLVLVWRGTEWISGFDRTKGRAINVMIDL